MGDKKFPTRQNPKPQSKREGICKDDDYPKSTEIYLGRRKGSSELTAILGVKVD
jgi:hypothetical protein